MHLDCLFSAIGRENKSFFVLFLFLFVTAVVCALLGPCHVNVLGFLQVCNGKWHEAHSGGTNPVNAKHRWGCRKVRLAVC